MDVMKGRLWLGLFLAAVAIGSASANTWPRLTGDKNLPQCQEAFRVAKAAFDSPLFDINTGLVPHVTLESKFVVGPVSEQSMKVDESVFDWSPGKKLGNLPIKAWELPDLAWQKRAVDGTRLVLQVVYSAKYSKTYYSLYAIPEKAGHDEFRSGVGRGSITTPVDWGEYSPWVLLDSRSRKFWVLDIERSSEPRGFMQDWRVFMLSKQGLEARCSIEFRPNVDAAQKLLPKPVQEFAALVDQTLGSGENDGALQSTLGTRIGMQKTWANLALRPWALSTPHNVREEVDRGLKEWSRVNKRRRRVYVAIREQYPKAEAALAHYYVQKFHKSPVQARKLAAFGVDVAFRENFTFPSTNVLPYGPPDEPNPWRMNEQRKR